MKKIYILLIALLAFSGVRAQSCLPGGITFTTQTDIDNFQTNYPGCTQIEGNITINGSDITNLNGFSVVTSIGGYLSIYVNGALTSLTGLEGLTSIGGILQIYNNDALTSLTGLEGLTSIGGYLLISDNGALTSLMGLEGLTSIGGYLEISNNGALTSLTGLDNIDAGSISNLYIYYNNTLSTCEVQSVCDYLASPNGTIEINDNATGCNSQEEAQAHCALPAQVPISNWALILGGALIALGVFVRYRRIV